MSKHPWKQIQVSEGLSTSPDYMIFSPKYWVEIPCSLRRLKSIPELISI